MRGYWKYLAPAFALGLMAFTGAAQTKVPNSTQSANRLTGDSTFASKAAQGGMAEVKLGELAKDHASSSEVKQFAQRMIDDHTKANDELKSIAAKENINLPTGLSAKDQTTYDRLAKLNGASFDKAYMKDMVSDHRADVAEFQREANHGTNPQLKTFAGNTLSTLQQHLQLAEKTAKDMTGK